MPRPHLTVLVLILGCAPAQTAEPTIKDHRFVPDQVTVPAGEKFKIEVVKQDDTPEEFESHNLKVEKIVTPGGTIFVTAGPLKPGQYRFVGEYHEDTANGTVTVTAVAPAKE